ncbi:Hypothetical predicted protein [Pelobates cultripes]|uniref:Uncharacterized protein n=1 Tax=Pelobates cultripes TaxID=61616 RepID=A0AAD1R0Z2_PELCU|nr:Hypothetical predicted protein [Pelobates cultripes]
MAADRRRVCLFHDPEGSKETSGNKLVRRLLWQATSHYYSNQAKHPSKERLTTHSHLCIEPQSKSLSTKPQSGTGGQHPQGYKRMGTTMLHNPLDNPASPLLLLPVEHEHDCNLEYQRQA